MSDPRLWECRFEWCGKDGRACDSHKGHWEGPPEPVQPDICQRCGQRNVCAWSVESPLWNLVTEGPASLGTNRYVIWCPQCFTQEYERITGERPVWQLSKRAALGEGE